MTSRTRLLLTLGVSSAWVVACLAPSQDKSTPVLHPAFLTAPVPAASSVASSSRGGLRMPVRCASSHFPGQMVETGRGSGRNSAGCLSGMNGCADYELLMAPFCGRRDDALTLEEVLTMPSPEAGQRVVVVGFIGDLRQRICTAAQCLTERCCNRCSRDFVLNAMFNDVCMQIGMMRSLETRTPLPSLGCSGDESMMCCNDHLFGRAVQVSGSLVLGGPAGQPARPDSILVEDLCLIEEPW